MNTVPNADAMPTLQDALALAHLQSLWDRYTRLASREPRAVRPHRWAWRELEPLIERAVREVSMEDAERRVLLLKHPEHGGDGFTTSTLSGGLQILQPGESARAHRHTMAALRFVMSGQGAVTVVDGKTCPMSPGDLILTPAWTWHEHQHRGSERMVWFDGLDMPLVRQLDFMFFEMGPGEMPAGGLAQLGDQALSEGGLMPAGFDAGTGGSPLYRYPWAAVVRALDAMPPADDGSRRLRYVNPLTGGAVLPTVDCHVLRLGAPGKAVRLPYSTEAAMAIVVEGEGQSRFGDTTMSWQAHDVMAVPRWTAIEHVATRGPATLFVMSDRELLSRLGYLRELPPAPLP